MDDSIMEAFSVRASGDIGQVVLDPDGKIIAWTTDTWVAQVIARLMSENEKLVLIEKEKSKMKRFIVEQNGYVQLEATRIFVVEVPDHISEEQAQELVNDLQETFPEDEGMEWSDQPDRKWIGYDVEIEETDVYDPDTVLGSPNTEGLRVIRLEGSGKTGPKGARS